MSDGALPRSMLEALASSAIIEGLSPEQQAYEKWLDDVDYGGPWPQIPWSELTSDMHYRWRTNLHVIKPGAKNDTKLRATVRQIPNNRAPKREWIASSNGDPEMRNRPKCPLCTSLKKSTPCRGGPPCSECKRKGYTASECQNYVPGQGNKGRRRVFLDGSERPKKRPRVGTKPEKPKEHDVARREEELGSLVGEETPPSYEEQEKDSEI